MSRSLRNLRDLVTVLRTRGDILDIEVEVDPRLELAEIHRRIIEREGPALFFRRVKGSRFPVVTNLFGTKGRVDLAFGDHAKSLIAEMAKFPQELLPPSLSKLWAKRSTLTALARIGVIERNNPCNFVSREANLDELPIITSWPDDGGPFFTLPLVYTEDPLTHIHNVGVYRMQKHSSRSTGMHMQIGKGGGFHLATARKKGTKLPVNVFLGGPPAAILSAIAPLPENVPELLLTSLVLGEKLKLFRTPLSELPLLAEAEFVLSGTVDPSEFAPEGPFGDHYGYYSLTHDFPVFRVEKIHHRRDAIFPATIVGKPRQEDYFIGNYLQELLRPLFPLVMPGVEDLWSYGETGYHSLAAAVVRERYDREALVWGFRILGEGQLSLTKFLLLVDEKLDLTDFQSVLQYVLERANFGSDFFLFSNVSMDTLDYTGPKLNHGSKGILLGIGEKRRSLPQDFRKNLPPHVRTVAVYCPGCLCVSGDSYSANPNFAQELTALEEFQEWPLIVCCDDASRVASSSASFLWHTFTRFEPAGDIFAKSVELRRYHPVFEPPIVIDARMKPSYPAEVQCDEKTSALVNKRWSEYFPKGQR